MSLGESNMIRELVNGALSGGVFHGAARNLFYLALMANLAKKAEIAIGGSGFAG
jgi:hypothetical protein